MNKITDELLRILSGFKGKFNGAFNIRENGQCAGRQSGENSLMEPKSNAPGFAIRILPETRGETVYIPACVTRGNVDDLAYNDFYVGENAQVHIIAGCGVRTDDGHDARSNGIHRFFPDKGAHVIYRKRHIGTGRGGVVQRINPVSGAVLAEDSIFEMDTAQLGGGDSALRKTECKLAARAKLLVRECIS